MTPREKKLVQAAQAYDQAFRSPLTSWTRVPDEQVLRLITGAQVLVTPDSRHCDIADQLKWAMEWVRDQCAAVRSA